MLRYAEQRWPNLMVTRGSRQAPELRTDKHFVGSASTASRIQNTGLLIDLFYQLGHRVAYRKLLTKEAQLNYRELDHRPDFMLLEGEK